MPYIHNPMPKVTRLGSKTHYNAVKNLYRRTLKWWKFNYKFELDKWDWAAYNIRKEFERCRDMNDAGEVDSLMKELEETLDMWDHQYPYIPPWDGPAAPAFMRYPYKPKKYFEWKDADTNYDVEWIDETSDEHFAKKEIQIWRGKYILLFREITRESEDYGTWLHLKKKMELELKTKIEDIQRKMNKSTWDYLMDWPYNCVNEFNDGYKPEYSLDIAFQDHWDEQLWRHVANLDENEKELVSNYDMQDGNSLRSIDRYLPK